MNMALEGHSYSGKTTLFNHAVATLDVTPIAEHDVYAGGIDNFPSFPAVNKEMAEYNVDFFVELEKKRAIDAKGSKFPVLYDRSFFSVILFQSYLKHLNKPDHINAYDYSKSQFGHLLLSKAINVPDILIYVTCEDDEVYASRQGREISVGILRGKNALNFFYVAYGAINEVYRKRGRLLELSSNNTLKNLAHNTELIQLRFDQQSFTPTESIEVASEVMSNI